MSSERAEARGGRGGETKRGPCFVACWRADRVGSAVAGAPAVVGRRTADRQGRAPVGRGLRAGRAGERGAGRTV